MNRFEIPPLPKRVEEESALGEGILSEISNRCRGNIANMIFIDDSPFKTERRYPNPIRLIDVNSERELHIPAEAFPEGLVDPDVEVSLKKEFEFPKEQSSTIGFIRVNGVEYPIVGFESTSAGFGRNGDDVLWQEVEWDDCEGSYREPTLDSFSQFKFNNRIKYNK